MSEAESKPSAGKWRRWWPPQVSTSSLNHIALHAFIALIAVSAILYFAQDNTDSYTPYHAFGWDAGVTCAAVDAYRDGLDPYYVKNLKITTLSYAYLPMTLDLLRPACSNGFLLHHFRALYLSLALLVAFLISLVSLTRASLQQFLLKSIFVYFAFAGFEWLFRTGNIAIFDGLLMAGSLCLLFHGFSTRENNRRDWHPTAYYKLGAALLGFAASIKVVSFPLLLGLYCLPVKRPEKLALIRLAAVCFLLPFLISWLFHNELFYSWLDCAFGLIPGQHSAATEPCSTSLLCMAMTLAGQAASTPGSARHLGGVLYALFASGLTGALGFAVVRLVRQEPRERRGLSFLADLDQLLTDHPRFAIHLTVLVMFALFLCLPRLKQYAFFDLAICAAALVTSLPPWKLAVVYAAAILIPIASNQPRADWGSVLFSGFDQTVAAVFCYVILLSDLLPAFQRYQAETLLSTVRREESNAAAQTIGEQPSLELIGMTPVENETASPRWRRWWSPQVVLLLTFACFYFAIGPGNFFGVDEALEEETAQALILRRTIDIPVMIDARLGRAQSYYTVKGPGLPFASLPFVYLGLKLDDAFGSMNGGSLAGPPIGAQEQPLRWGGRLAISAALMVNALVGGGIVAMLFMVGMRLSGNARAALLMAVAAGVATLVMSEATHFYQHALDALMVLLAFWFFSGREIEALERRALFGGLALGVAIMARFDAVPAAVVLWLYGAIAAWKLVGDLPDHWLRMTYRTLMAGVGPAGGVAACMYFNYLRFGSVAQFGYTDEKERFVVDLVQITKVFAGYLVSPSLSIFLFAPPLILVAAIGRHAYRRWPLETGTLVSASFAHLLFFSFYKSWHGDLSYGPRNMLESIVLLMPLTLPAFEAVADLRSRRAAIAIAGLVLLGVVVQLIGVAVYVTVNEWHRIADGVLANGAWVFPPRSSPIVYDLRELFAGRNLSPWALRAFAQPGRALVLLIGLIALVRVGRWRMLQFFRAPEAELAKVSSDRLPAAIVLAAVIPICAGFALARTLNEPPNIHAVKMINAGVAAQEAGHAVTAAEYFALVLGIEPMNAVGQYDLGVLEEDAGRIPEALMLYQNASREDPAFALPRQHIVALGLKPMK